MTKFIAFMDCFGDSSESPRNDRIFSPNHKKRFAIAQYLKKTLRGGANIITLLLQRRNLNKIHKTIIGNDCRFMIDMQIQTFWILNYRFF